MSFEHFSTRPASTLASSINSSVTSLTVNSAATFPSSPNFRILIDDELLLVTGVSGATFTVTRGIEGTTAASHASAAAVTGVLTAAALDTRFSSLIVTDEFFNSGLSLNESNNSTNPGSLVVHNSGFLYYDNGSSWDKWETQKVLNNTSLANWYGVSSSNKLYSVNNAGTYLSDRGVFPVTDNYLFRTQTFSDSSDAWIIGKFFICPTFPTTETNGGGLCFLNNSANVKVTCGFDVSSGVYNFCSHLIQADNTVLSGDTSGEGFTYAVDNDPIKWIGMQYDGTNLYFYISFDGFHAYQVWKNNDSDWTSGLNEYGVYVNARSFPSSSNTNNGRTMVKIPYLKTGSSSDSPLF